MSRYYDYFKEQHHTGGDVTIDDYFAPADPERNVVPLH